MEKRIEETHPAAAALGGVDWDWEVCVPTRGWGRACARGLHPTTPTSRSEASSLSLPFSLSTQFSMSLRPVLGPPVAGRPPARPHQRLPIVHASPIGLANDAEREAVAAFSGDDATAGALLVTAAKAKVRVFVCGCVWAGLIGCSPKPNQPFSNLLTHSSRSTRTLSSPHSPTKRRAPPPPPTPSQRLMWWHPGT